MKNCIVSPNSSFHSGKVLQISKMHCVQDLISQMSACNTFQKQFALQCVFPITLIWQKSLQIIAWEAGIIFVATKGSDWALDSQGYFYWKEREFHTIQKVNMCLMPFINRPSAFSLASNFPSLPQTCPLTAVLNILLGLRPGTSPHLEISVCLLFCTFPSSLQTQNLLLLDALFHSHISSVIIFIFSFLI